LAPLLGLLGSKADEHRATNGLPCRRFDLDIQGKFRRATATARSVSFSWLDIVVEVLIREWRAI